MELSYEVNVLPNNYYKCISRFDSNQVCRCQISVEDNEWTISGWYTDDKYKNNGCGKKTMQYLLKYLYNEFGHPDEIQYIWNGTNRYVYDWIKENFDAYCRCPVVVQKYQAEDDWESHMYKLNIDKVLTYFGC